jgi:hypothetical protein
MDYSARNEIADPVLYRLYWGVQLPDILHKIGFDATEKNKRVLHDFHKRVLNYTTIAGRSQDIVSLFLFEVGCYWANHGIFVRSKENQPFNLLDLELKDCWQYL